MLLQHVSNSQSFQHFKDFAVGQFFDCHSTGFLVTLPPDPLILYPPSKIWKSLGRPKPSFRLVDRAATMRTEVAVLPIFNY